MKILYGVQGTGNGHITRARAMARALADAGAQVDWIFSGRAREDYFDMEVFGNFQNFRGLTFVIEHGRVLFGKTLLNNSLLELYRDIKALDVEGYDLIINDFEPVSAWAARLAGKQVIGVSHQNAFLHNIPKRGNNLFVAGFMRYFAPVTQPIGLHWHHFNLPILPPLVEAFSYANEPQADHYLVYLPFGDLEDLVPQLLVFPDYQFFVYHSVSVPRDDGHVHIRPFSREGFQRDLHHCEGVICNAGFELSSEAIHLGKKLLVLPVAGQMEQQSNALALSQLGYGSVTPALTEGALTRWLPLPRPQPVTYPNVARALAEWLVAGAEDFNRLHASLWHAIPEPVYSVA